MDIYCCNIKCNAVILFACLLSLKSEGKSFREVKNLIIKCLAKNKKKHQEIKKKHINC